MARIHVSNDPSGHIIVSFPYDPLLVSKVKTIDGRRWHPAEEHFSFPYTDGMLEKILKIFGDENVQIDHALKGTVPDLRTTYNYPPHRSGREREGVKKFESPACPVGRGLSPKYDSGGLRLGETARLEQAHLDRDRMLIFVKGAKGRKDRYTLLFEKALQLIDQYQYMKRYEPRKWLFEGARAGRYLSTRTVEKILEHACEKAVIRKDVSVHTLRHSFSTHLLEVGTDLRYIQELLGHKDSKTTEIYTNVSTKNIAKIKSPLDTLTLKKGGEE